MKMLGFVLTAALAVLPASASASPPQVVTIEVERPADVWSASGAIADSGTFADEQVIFNAGFTYHAFRTFTGSDGTFVARADVRIVPTTQPGVFDVTGEWAVIAGTGEYRDLHGTGTISETFNAITGAAGTWEGSMHFDERAA